MTRRSRFGFLGLLTLFALVLTPGCQCSDKPDIGPVEGDGTSAQVVVVEWVA